jgi:hypothetical protein
MNSLHKIGLKNGTDKSTFHNYMDFYEKHIDRDSVERFLEIGIYHGDSIRSWREWFNKSTVIEAWDIMNCPPITGCDIKVVDQTKKKMMKENVTGIYDVILDDGGHTAEMIQGSFSVLFPYSKMYILEDLHAPYIGDPAYMKPGDISTIDLLDNLSKDGWNSRYATQEEKDYIEKNAEVVDVFWQGESRDKPVSMTCIVINKEYKK